MLALAVLFAVTTDQVAVGTVSGLLIAVSAAVFKLYGTANDERKRNAERRVEDVEKDMADAKEAHAAAIEAQSQRHARDWDEWRRRETDYRQQIADLNVALRECWERKP